MNGRIGIWKINTFGRESFVRLLGGIFEHSPWVADKAWEFRPFRSRRELHETMIGIVAEASSAQIMSLIRAHPDLAGRFQITGFSALEQQAAGLDRLMPQEIERFAQLNKAYADKFGFPFILAVKGKTKSDILSAMEERLSNTEPEEKARALQEIARIAEIRLAEIVEE
jgi:2-oxo-4-hydroxy-4-carboxy-5-ureidoimidazoline decarboxylase